MCRDRAVLMSCHLQEFGRHCSSVRCCTNQACFKRWQWFWGLKPLWWQQWQLRKRWMNRCVIIFKEAIGVFVCVCVGVHLSCLVFMCIMDLIYLNKPNNNNPDCKPIEAHSSSCSLPLCYSFLNSIILYITVFGKYRLINCKYVFCCLWFNDEHANRASYGRFWWPTTRTVRYAEASWYKRSNVRMFFPYTFARLTQRRATS